jgi:hypothetical protein
MYEQLAKVLAKSNTDCVEFDMCKTFLFKKNTEKKNLKEIFVRAFIEKDFTLVYY